MQPLFKNLVLPSHFSPVIPDWIAIKPAQKILVLHIIRYCRDKGDKWVSFWPSQLASTWTAPGIDSSLMNDLLAKLKCDHQILDLEPEDQTYQVNEKFIRMFAISLKTEQAPTLTNEEMARIIRKADFRLDCACA